MGHRLTKIYTRTGDDGKTQVCASERIMKNSARIEALGTLDELNCSIGCLLALSFENTDLKECLTQVQHDLFNLGGELCPPHHQAITDAHATQLENKIDEWNETLPPLKEFILPRGSLATASCHMARAICRRAERTLVSLNEEEKFNPAILRYINRLSDALFVAARLLGKENSQKEVLWEHERKK